VPHASLCAGHNAHFLKAAELLVGDLHLVQEDLPVSWEMRFRMVSRTARGCSKISFA